VRWALLSLVARCTASASSEGDLCVSKAPASVHDSDVAKCGEWCKSTHCATMCKCRACSFCDLKEPAVPSHKHEHGHEAKALPRPPPPPVPPSPPAMIASFQLGQRSGGVEDACSSAFPTWSVLTQWQTGYKAQATLVSAEAGKKSAWPRRQPIVLEFSEQVVPASSWGTLGGSVHAIENGAGTLVFVTLSDKPATSNGQSGDTGFGLIVRTGPNPGVPKPPRVRCVMPPPPSLPTSPPPQVQLPPPPSALSPYPSPTPQPPPPLSGEGGVDPPADGRAKSPTMVAGGDGSARQQQAPASGAVGGADAGADHVEIDVTVLLGVVAILLLILIVELARRPANLVSTSSPTGKEAQRGRRYSRAAKGEDRQASSSLVLDPLSEDEEEA